jgi:hypothetical protein
MYFIFQLRDTSMMCNDLNIINELMNYIYYYIKTVSFNLTRKYTRLPRGSNFIYKFNIHDMTTLIHNVHLKT